MQSQNSILILVNTLSFLKSHRSEILEKLSEKDWAVEVLSIKNPKRIRQKGIKSFYLQISYLCKLFLNIIGSRHSVIHVISPKAILAFLLVRFLFINKNVLLAFSGFGFLKSLINSSFGFFILFIFKILVSRFSGIMLVQNSEDAKICSRFGVDQERITLIRGSGFNYKFAERCGYLNPSLPTRTRFLFASRLLKSKGVLDFVEAAISMQLSGSESEFVIAGSFDENNPSSITRQQFESIRQSKIVEYIGEDADILAEIGKSSCVVLPSTYGEGLPKILIEAACLGRPIITTDLAGCRDAVLDGETGLLCKPNNINQLVKAMGKIENDPELTIAFGERAKSLGKNLFNVDRVVDEHMKIYHKLLDD